jgi:transposase
MLEEVHTMGTKRPYYTPEFRAEAVQLVQSSGKAVNQMAKDIGVSESALRKWVRQADIDEGKGPEGALTTEERAELSRLRRENRQLTMERDFLKKVSSFVCHESTART